MPPEAATSSTTMVFPSTYRDAGCNAAPGRNASKQCKYWTAGQPEAMAIKPPMSVAMPSVDYDGWRNSELSQDTSTWERQKFTSICEIMAIVPWYLVDPEMMWVQVKRVRAETIATQCFNGKACENAECPFLHNGDVSKEDIVEEFDDLANLDNYTYYSLELGPALFWPDVQNDTHNPSKCVAKQFLKDIGHKHGRIYVTNSKIHISLAYSPLVSIFEARMHRSGLNRVMRRYWSLAPRDRVEGLSWNRKFYLKQDGWETVEAMDNKVDVATWGETHVENSWHSGQLWHECRPISHHSRRHSYSDSDDSNDRDNLLTTPSHDDFINIQQTWSNAHTLFMQRSRGVRSHFGSSHFWLE